jgi:hypothetical protein
MRVAVNDLRVLSSSETRHDELHGFEADRRRLRRFERAPGYRDD